MRDIKNDVGTFPSIGALARYLGRNKEYVRGLMEGIDCLQDGKAKRYFAGDVAERIMQRRTR